MAYWFKVLYWWGIKVKISIYRQILPRPIRRWTLEYNTNWKSLWLQKIKTTVKNWTYFEKNGRYFIVSFYFYPNQNIWIILNLFSERLLPSTALNKKPWWKKDLGSIQPMFWPDWSLGWWFFGSLSSILVMLFVPQWVNSTQTCIIFIDGRTYSFAYHLAIDCHKVFDFLHPSFTFWRNLKTVLYTMQFEKFILIKK